MLKLLSIFFFILLVSCDNSNEIGSISDKIQLISIKVGTVKLSSSELIEEVGVDQPIVAEFSHPLSKSTISDNFKLLDENLENLELEFSFLNNDKSVSAKPISPLETSKKYQIEISNKILGENGETFEGIDISFVTLTPQLEITKVLIDDVEVNVQQRTKDISRTPQFQLEFSESVKVEDIAKHTKISFGNTIANYITQQADDQSITFKIDNALAGYKKYRFSISKDLSTETNKTFDGFNMDFYTELDSSQKFPEISDDQLLTKIQEQTFKYFWDFGHPESGLIRERNTSGDNVTIGGSGFGLMAIIVGIERGFIGRTQGIERLEKMVNFLETKAERFHGVWSHWLSGTTGKVNPFSSNDDGGDLVESAFMVQGLITVRQYLNPLDVGESALIEKINDLWGSVEWDWYTQGGQDVLYWHWSPNFGWEKNHKISGWNEALIVYVLAASSPTHGISKDVYTSGWSRNGEMVNSSGQEYFGYRLPLRSDMGGPLFFSHYSFLGLDPRNLVDQYADYWTQNVNHSSINMTYCASNPKNYVGYTPYCWGLTASDGNSGYSAHSPDNDRGVITPTAAISSIPYTPDESMTAIRHFYYILGDRLWGDYGFVDAFNITENWTADSYLAIDQGPIIIMIENHRTGLLWDLFMSAPEIQNGLTKLDFTSFN